MIRPYILKDKEKLLEIFELNTPKYFDRAEITDFRDYLEQHADKYFTIEKDNGIVGGIGCKVNELQQGSVTWIFFHPQYYGQGLGTQAVKYCHDVLVRDSSIKKFTVRTSQLACAFFERFGYITIRTTKDYWGKGLDLYEMEMPINR